jgi:HEAT repeat protein
LRRQVLFAVSETGSADARPWLLERARDTTEALDVRRQALFWAADVGVTAEELNGLYHSFDEPRLREHLIWLIAEEGGDDSVELLIDIARNDPDPEMRTKAIFWIGDSDDPRAAEYLLDLLQP